MNHKSEIGTLRGGGLRVPSYESRFGGDGGEVGAEVPVARARSGIKPEPRIETDAGVSRPCMYYFCMNYTNAQQAKTHQAASSSAGLAAFGLGRHVGLF